MRQWFKVNIKKSYLKGERKMKSVVRNQKGFTLVELAIVLVIIGLILGSVLKGQEMINNAKIKNLVNQHNALLAAFYSYYDKYGAYPGDDIAATTHLGNSGCSGITNGNGNGLVTEYYDALQHLACGGFITGSYDGATQTGTHVYGGAYYIYYQTIQGKTGNLIRFDNLTAEVAQQLDQKLDDGVYNTGSVRASADYAAGTTIAQTGCYF